ncbi:MAG: hypothetical protein OXU37_07410 [Thaumarchaeota archaeon]|nr:hypothetical protein [Nitrososphaerota archaeon]MDD9842909.1 hypothetical protein [Nitrososphaerota archaeon]
MLRSVMDGTFPVRTAWETEHWTGDDLRKFLSSKAPLGQTYVYHALDVHMMNHRDFEAACDHFGIRHLLVDITLGEVFDEMDARRARNEPPSTGPLPLFLNQMSREEADARIAIYNRRVSEAEAAMAAPAPSWAGATPRAHAGRHGRPPPVGPHRRDDGPGGRLPAHSPHKVN